MRSPWLDQRGRCDRTVVLIFSDCQAERKIERAPIRRSLRGDGALALLQSRFRYDQEFAAPGDILSSGTSLAIHLKFDRH